MKRPTLMVVNGAYDWSAHFPDFDVVHVRVQHSRWVLEGGALRVSDHRGAWRPDVLLWRLGAVTPHPSHRAVLELVRLSGVTCVNPARALLRGYDRLSMLAELREAGLPVVPFDVAVGQGALASLAARSPAVLKAGNLHGGDGKARAMTDDHWRELTSLAALAHDYVSVEPFLDYARDIRCMIVGERVWAMNRRAKGWRANVGTQIAELVEPPERMASQTLAFARHIGADVLGLDFLELRDGSHVVLESNDIPGVLGWPRDVLEAIAERTRASWQASRAL